VSAAAPVRAVPDLDFRVVEASVWEHAAAPTLRFGVEVECAGAEPIRALQLGVQLRIAAQSRAYDAATQARLADLFGAPERWRSTLRSLYWTQATVSVPAFTGRTRVELPVACTYDFEVASAKYFHGVRDGEIPLELLFSGSIFYADEQGALQVARIAWEKEARYRLPAALWQEMMGHYFPNSGWLRLRSDSFDRLYDFRARHALPSWEAALDLLLQRAAAGEEA
jgi:hypothetical protein